MAKKVQAPPKNFEEALKELEEILGEIESGEIGLEQSLAKYERGNFLIQHCRGVLGAAEKQIELLSKGDAGELVSQPLNEDNGGRNGGKEDGGEDGGEEDSTC